MDRYEEALEKARAGKSLEEIFPEMKESEDERDERIRKELWEYFHELELSSDRDFSPSFTIDHILAWLEKKKALPTNEEMLRTLRVEYEKGVADTIAKYEQKEQTEELSIRLNGVMQEYVKAGKDEEEQEHRLKSYQLFWDALGDSEFFVQKEQKPNKQEWNKEDEEMRITILQEIANIKDVFPKINIQPEFDWLKSLPERFNLRSKQEWSEDYNEEKIQTRFAFYTYKDDPSVLYLSNVFVEETSRNHGFGTRILRAAEKVAETIGATTISLKVKQNSPANAWYRKNGYGYVAFEDGYDWLEKNLEYVNPNEQDWSKEDERKLRAVISLMKSSRAVDPFYDKMLLEGWLKSLPERFNLQPKQGWSEEDEEMRGTCIDLLEHFPRPCGEVIGPWKDCIDWLKSLRPVSKESLQPHWKPSEEQMGMLLAVINDPNNAGAESCHLMLQSLYADLEKL